MKNWTLSRGNFNSKGRLFVPLHSLSAGENSTVKVIFSPGELVEFSSFWGVLGVVNL